MNCDCLQMDRVVKPGFVSITWTSTNLYSYLNDVKTHMISLDRLIATVCSIVYHFTPLHIKLCFCQNLAIRSWFLLAFRYS